MFKWPTPSLLSLLSLFLSSIMDICQHPILRHLSWSSSSRPFFLRCRSKQWVCSQRVPNLFPFSFYCVYQGSFSTSHHFFIFPNVLYTWFSPFASMSTFRKPSVFLCPLSCGPCLCFVHHPTLHISVSIIHFFIFLFSLPLRSCPLLGTAFFPIVIPSFCHPFYSAVAFRLDVV